MSKCQLFSFNEDLREVVPDGLYMQSVVGETMSVGVVNFRLPAGPGIEPKSHAHGEECTLQIRGGCTVNLGHSVTEPDGAVLLQEGSVMLMPADQAHSGINSFDPGGWSLRLNVVTPPRAEYGSKGQSKVYYPTSDEKGAAR